MFLWAALPMAASIGMSAYSAYSGGKEGVKNAESNAKIEAMNIAFQNKMFLKTLEAQKPYIEAGAAAIPRYNEAVKGRGDGMRGGLAQMQKGMIEKGTAGMSDYAKQAAAKRLEAEEDEKEKSRLLDLQKIGLGYSGAAGSATINYGNAMASSYSRAAESNVNAEMNRNAANQNMWTQSLDAISSIPAYYASTQKGNNNNNRTR